MELIFEQGDKLKEKQYITQEKLNDSCMKVFEKLKGTTFYECQRNQLINLIKIKEPNHTIYGDDFKIGIYNKNFEGNCVLIIEDYDENQKLESEIALDFNKEELGQFIALLQSVRESL